MPLQKMRRYRYLAKPVKRDISEKPDWTLTYEMRKYKSSERLNNLAQPKIRDTSMLYQDLPIKIPLTVLKHKGMLCLSLYPSNPKTNIVILLFKYQCSFETHKKFGSTPGYTNGPDDVCRVTRKSICYITQCP